MADEPITTTTPEGQQQVQVLLDERDLKTMYANAYRIHQSLEEVVLDLERHSAREGWDSAPRLYALVRSGELRRTEPGLADQLGLAPDADTLAALEQPPLPEKDALEDALASD